MLLSGLTQWGAIGRDRDHLRTRVGTLLLSRADALTCKARGELSVFRQSAPGRPAYKARPQCGTRPGSVARTWTLVGGRAQAHPHRANREQARPLRLARCGG